MQSSTIANMEHFTPDMITLIGEVNRLEKMLSASQAECRRLRTLLTKALSGKGGKTKALKVKEKALKAKEKAKALKAKEKAKAQEAKKAEKLAAKEAKKAEKLAAKEAKQIAKAAEKLAAKEAKKAEKQSSKKADKTSKSQTKKSGKRDQKKAELKAELAKYGVISKATTIGELRKEINAAKKVMKTEPVNTE